MKTLFEGVWENKGLLLTLNIDKGKKVYNEKLIVIDGKEYRTWNPYRSKLAGAIMKGLRTFPFSKKTKVLYLGASTGTTVSHLSDIIREGEIYAVEISSQMMKSLLEIANRRENIIPIHADARLPDEYGEIGKVDVVYQDVAQPDQEDILIRNARMFLKKDGIAMLCIKSQSIDVVAEPKVVFDRVLKKLSAFFEVIEKIKLEPYDKDHLFVVLRYKGN
ncbi:MAG: fibrillarin-like rRNA/tRNA 2'-O-methyltransferase [Candidatus Bilamarchaeaceae archaeon]